MGCDIHIKAEVREGNEWNIVGRVFKNLYWKEETEGDYTYYFGPLTDEPYEGRSYNLFSILADVRNDRGFAGISTGEGFEPIAMPRGVPDDASPEYRALVERWGIDGHSHSWLTLDELKTFPWDDKHTVQYGVVSEEKYLERQKSGEDYKLYSGDIWGPKIVTLRKAQYDTLAKESPDRLDKLREEGARLYIRDEWRVSYREAVGLRFFEITLPALEMLKTDSNDVRIVFFFDN
jgi:hypothetical protein